MNSIRNQLLKYYRMIARTRTSLLVIVLGPLLVMLLAGLAFNTSSSKITIGTYSDNYNELTQSIVSAINDNDFKTVKVDSPDECAKNIEYGNIDLCMVFPADMELSNDKKNEIQYYVDYSKINLVWMVLEAISNKLDVKKDELSLNLTNVLLTKLEETKKEVEDKKPLTAEMTNQNAQIEVLSVDIVKKLDALSFELDRSGFKTEESRDKNAELRNALDNLTAFIANSTADIEVMINDLSLSIDDLKTDNATSSLYNEINSSLQEQLFSIQELQNMTNMSINETIALTDELMNNVGAVEQELTKLDTRLSEAAKAKEDIKVQVDNIKKVLNDGLITISKIQKSYNSIVENINSIKVTDASRIVSPVTTKIIPVSSKKTNLDFSFPTLMGLIVMMLCLILASSLVIMEKKSKAFFRNNITPTPSRIFIMSTYVTNMIIVFAQLIVMLIVAGIVFKVDVGHTAPSLFLILFAAGTAFVLIGMLIGYMFNSQETAMLGSVSVGALLLFLSNTIIPIQSMPVAIQDIVKFNPFVLMESMLRKVLIFESNITVYGSDLVIMLAYAAIIMVFVALSERYLRDQNVAYRKQMRHIRKETKKLSATEKAVLQKKRKVVENSVWEGMDAASSFKIKIAKLKYLEARNLVDAMPKEKELFRTKLERLYSRIKLQEQIFQQHLAMQQTSVCGAELKEIEESIRRNEKQKALLLIRHLESKHNTNKEVMIELDKLRQRLS